MIRCLAVDDSPLALELLETYIARIGDLQPAGACTNAIEAMELLRKDAIDLLFLDIQMPDITGIELLRSLPRKPKVIITTAYPNYAVQGFDLDVSDYLVKPFSFERFSKAVEKVRTQLELEKNAGKEKCIYVRSGHETVKIALDDIEYIEALKDYIQLYVHGKKILSLMSMKEILELLPADRFVRIHRSFIIPLEKVSRIAARKIRLGDKEIPVGEMYRAAFQEALRRKNIRF